MTGIKSLAAYHIFWFASASRLIELLLTNLVLSGSISLSESRDNLGLKNTWENDIIRFGL